MSGPPEGSPMRLRIRRALHAGGGASSSAPLKEKLSSVGPGGEKREEFSNYIQGITSVWILHPICVGVLGRYLALDHGGILEGVMVAPSGLLLWQLVACFASLWYWWDRCNAVAKWLDRFMAVGCGVGYMTYMGSVGGVALAVSLVLLTFTLVFFTSGWLVNDWMWCHTGFRFSIFWLSFLTMTNGLMLPSAQEWAFLVLVTSLGMFGHIFIEERLAAKQGINFSLKAGYSQGILRSGAAAATCGSLVWMVAM